MSTKFQLLQKEWYARLAAEGFKDIETVRQGAENQGGRPLKSWSVNDRTQESPFIEKEKLLNSPELATVCESITRHGNSKIAWQKVELILSMHCEGKSNRAIAKELKISEYAIRSYLKKLQIWIGIL